MGAGEGISAVMPVASPGASAGLEEQTTSYWEGRSAEERQEYLIQLNGTYQAIVNDFFKLSSAAVDEFRTMVQQYLAARRRMIWMGGVMAIANILVSFVVSQGDNASLGKWSTVVKATGVVLPLCVAIYAAVVAVFSNLESLENHLTRAQASRHAREASLNAFRELEMLWHVYVRPFSDTPTACVNATNLYRRAVLKDQEVRSQVIEKTQPKAAS